MEFILNKKINREAGLMAPKRNNAEAELHTDSTAILKKVSKLTGEMIEERKNVVPKTLEELGI